MAIATTIAMNESARRNPQQLKAVKRATVGLIGDGVKEISISNLEKRVLDQCDRIGCFTPSWPTFVDLVRKINGSFCMDRNVVILPVA